MRNLALFLLLLNLFFMFWQLRLLSWLPWQPEQLSHANNPPSLEKVNDLPRLVLLGEHDISHTTDSKTQEYVVDNLAQKAVAENSLVTTVPSSIVEQNTIASSILPTKTHTATQIKTGINIVNIDTQVKTEITPPPLTIGSQTTIKQFTNDSNLAQEMIVGSYEKKTTISQLQQLSGLPMQTPNQPLSQGKLKDKKLAVVSTSLPLIKSEKLPKIEENALSKSEACFQIGPYPHIKLTTKIVKWLKIKKVMVKVQNRQTQRNATWVYLPPFKNRQAAYHARQRLNELGIDDHQVVTTGPFNNAISLGLYQKPFYAKQRFEKLVALGYKNVQKTQKPYKKDTKYWLNVKMPTHLQNTFKKKFKGWMLEPVACNKHINLN